MPRSSLVSLLRHMAVGIEREQRQERGEDFEVGRRTFVAGGAALLGSAALGLRPAFGLGTTARIAVVGAGLAGLTAAYRLQQQGYKPVVFEGNTRLGGRCYTARDIFANGQIAEHGGEFIDSDHTAIIGLVKELGLTLDDVLAAQPAGTIEQYLFNGQRYNLAQATQDFQALYPIVQQQNTAIGDYNYKHANATAKKFDAMTLRDWIVTYVPGGIASRLGRLLDNAFTEENAADTDQQSALNIIATIAVDPKENFNLYYTGSDQRYHVHGGNDQITTLLGEALGSLVQTGSTLTGISQTSDGRVRLSIQRDTASRSQVFDRVILALPFSILNYGVDYSSAGFQPLKQQAIQQLGMGASVKTQLQFSERLWNRLGCTGEIRLRSDIFQTSWDVTRAQPGTGGILNFWSGGTQALADNTVSQRRLAGLCLTECAPLLPGLARLWNGRASIDIWKNNPWSRGSYAVYGPGYQTSLYGIEQQAEGNCYFAGEHTWSQAGFLNAGVGSGERAARQVIKSLVV